MNKTLDVKGLIYDITKLSLPKPANVTIRYTKDSRGESLSLSAFNVMIHIPIDDKFKDMMKGTDNGKD